MKPENLDALKDVPETFELAQTAAGVGRGANFNDSNFQVARSTDARAASDAYRRYRAEWEQVLQDGGQYRSFPIHLQIESAFTCNLTCPMCYYSLEQFDQAKSGSPLMALDLYRKIIDEGAAKGLRSVKLNLRGEPLLHNRLPEMISYAREAGIVDVMFNTNATLLSEKKAREVVAAKPNLVIFSLDAARPETYAQARRGGDFAATMENVQRFIALKRELAPEIKTRAYFVVQELNKAEVPLFKEQWTGVADEVAFTDVSSLDFGANAVNGEKNCSVIWRQLAISYEGKVSFCDPDYNQELALGDLRTQSIEELWNGPLMNKLRRLAKSSQLNRLHPCSRCPGK